MIRKLLLATLAACSAAWAPADSTVSASNRCAHSANAGWLDARGDITNGAVLGQSYCSGSLWGANVGWISLGSGTPANGWQYANDSAADWGVNHDGAGSLKGYAYGANIGWITFEQAHGKPRIDLLTGNLYGYAWGANVGWISLSNAFARVQTERLSTGPDTDGDGIPDAWEYRRAASLRVLGPGAADADRDGVADADEYGADTDPRDPLSALRITDFLRDGDLSTVFWDVTPTRHYRLQRADAPSNGVAWADSGMGLLAPAAAGSLKRGVTHTNAASFYRVQALTPLVP